MTLREGRDPARITEDATASSALRALFRNAADEPPIAEQRLARSHAAVLAAAAAPTAAVALWGKLVSGKLVGGKIGALLACALATSTAVVGITVHRALLHSAPVSAAATATNDENPAVRTRHASRRHARGHPPAVRSATTSAPELSRFSVEPTAPQVVARASVLPPVDASPASPSRGLGTRVARSSPRAAPPEPTEAVVRAEGMMIGNVEVPATTSSEARALLAAREALRRGATSDALAQLEAARRRFAQPTLHEEADAMRTEALFALGRLSEARRALSEFDVAYPHSPYRERLGSLEMNGR